MLKVLALCLFLLTTPLIAIAADPTGAATGGASDIVAANPSAPTLQELAAEVGHSKVASNFVWMLLAGFLVMFMQAGFAFCETGFTRAKNASHTMAMNMMVYGIGLLGYWACVGLFADGTYGAGLNGVAGGVRGLFYGGGMGQLTAEIIGAVACIAFTFTAFHVFFKVIELVVGNRVSEAVELEGLDIGEIGVAAYPEFLPAPAVVTTAQPEIIPVAASSSVPIFDESLAVG